MRGTEKVYVYCGSSPLLFFFYIFTGLQFVLLAVAAQVYGRISKIPW